MNWARLFLAWVLSALTVERATEGEEVKAWEDIFAVLFGTAVFYAILTAAIGG